MEEAPSTSETVTPVLSLENVNGQFDAVINQFGMVVIIVSWQPVRTN